MRGWLEATGIGSTAPALEIYHRFGADQSGYQLPSHVIASRADHYVTEIQIPIRLPEEVT